MNSTLFKASGHLYSVETQILVITDTKDIVVKRIDLDNQIIAIMNYSDHHESACIDFLDAGGLIDRQESYNYFDVKADSKEWLESFGRWCVELSEI